MGPSRPVFHAKIGRFLVELREARGWSQEKAVIKAGRRITKGTLKSLERGGIKHPDSHDLKVLASLYGVSYESLAERFVMANYGTDLIRHAGDQSSRLPQGGPHADAASTRVLELEKENERLRVALSEIENIADQLIQIAQARSAGSGTRTPRSGRRASVRATN